jgi:outer membrane protein
MLVLLAAAWLAPPSVHAQTPKTYSLDAAQRMALDNYEAIRAARERTVQAEDMFRVAGSALLPQIITSNTFTRNLITAELEFGGQTVQILPALDYNLAVSVVQPIYSGQRMQKGKQQAALGVDVATKSFGVTAQDTLLDVVQAFYRVLSAQDNVEISRRSLVFSEETLRTSQSLYNAGEAVETAVLRARVAQSDAKRQLLEAENGLTLAKQQLMVLTGIDGDYQVARPERPHAFGQPLDQLIKMGIDGRRELQALAIQKKIAQLEIEKQRGLYRPSIDAQATYLQRRADFPSRALSSVSVNATWSIFDGGRTPAQIAAARSSLRALEVGEELAKKQTELQIRSAYLTMDTLAASVDMLTAQVEFARMNAESTARAFKVGEATDLDMLQANATLTRSERELAVTSNSLDVAVYALQRAVGMFATDLVPASGEDQ